MRGFFDAVSLLTRVPTRAGADTKRAVPWLPVIGALIGAAVAGVYAGMRAVATPMVAATVAVGLGILLTGALHEDGLADTADAFGARVDRARTLEILKDPRNGTYGVLALILSVLARVAAVGALRPWTALAALTAAHAASRGAAGGSMWLFPAATSSGLSAAYRGGSTARGALIGVTFSVVIAVLFLHVWAITATLLVTMIVLAVGAFSMRKIGGVTGDVLGATQQLCEIGILILAVAARDSIPWWHR